jgi:hypothetical protein
VLRQADVEGVLDRALTECGVQVDQETELVALDARPGWETTVLLRSRIGPRTRGRRSPSIAAQQTRSPKSDGALARAGTG